MKEIADLERLGYEFEPRGDTIHFAHHGSRPPPEEVRPKLEYLRRHRKEVLCFLRERHELLDQMEIMEQSEWCRKWADLAARAGWPCTGYQSWTDWLEDVRAVPRLPPEQHEKAVRMNW